MHVSLGAEESEFNATMLSTITFYPLMGTSMTSVYIILYITFANSLNPDQDRQNISPDMDTKCLTL